MDWDAPNAPKIEDFRDYLMVLARSRVGGTPASHLDASDIVQETLLEAHRKRDQFRGSDPASMAVWLRQMMAFHFADRLRYRNRQKRDPARELRSVESSLGASSSGLENLLGVQQSSPSRKLMRQESIFALASALEQLPESQREAIRMKYIEGRSVLEIAKAMEKSVTAVAGLLKRGLDGLRESMAAP